jgi:outer membrane protein OmpA-like peptidoglycan-associated protein
MRRSVLGLAVLLLAACQTPPPPAPPPPVAPKVQPPPPSPPPSRPVSTQTAGPLAPAGVEKYLDGLERALRVLVKGPNVRVMRRGDSLLVVLPDALLFGGENLSAAGETLAGQIARALRYYDRTAVVLNGYSDTAGAADRNQAISFARAGVLAAALGRGGIAESRLEPHGLGAADPRYVNEKGRAEPRNRRIEIVLLPKPE